MNILCYTSLVPDFLKMAKALFKKIVKKFLTFRTKIDNFWTSLIVSKMIWLATRFISELIGVGAAPGLCNP